MLKEKSIEKHTRLFKYQLIHNFEAENAELKKKEKSFLDLIETENGHLANTIREIQNYEMELAQLRKQCLAYQIYYALLRNFLLVFLKERKARVGN